MANISNFKINERSNVERKQIVKCKQFQNLLIFWNFDSFRNWKNSKNMLIFQVLKF